MHSNDMNPNRRAVLSAGLAAIAGFALARPAFAISTSQATALITGVMDEAMKVVNSSMSQSNALKAFEQILARNSEMSLIARSVLGQPWRSASAAQQKAFTAAFQSYVSRKYGKEFQEYRGSTIKILNSQDRGRKGILVATSVNIPGSAPIAVEWQVVDIGGRPKVFDLLIEGISMVGTERVEVRAILERNRNNLDATIQQLAGRG